MCIWIYLRHCDVSPFFKIAFQVAFIYIGVQLCDKQAMILFNDRKNI